MAEYPKSIIAVREALLTFTPHAVVADAINAAQSHASPVVQIIAVFDALKGRVGSTAPAAEGDEPTPVLDRAGLKLLAGAAHLISENAWHQMGAAALPQLMTATVALDALPPEETPAPLTPPSEGGS